jgi:Bacterial Ig domain/Secretion system C-terminal sorting domain
LVDSINADINGNYQFTRIPEKIIADNFDLTTGGNSCASGTDGTAPWRNDWVDANDLSSVGFCVTPAQSAANTDVEIEKDSIYSYALRLDDANRSATREFNMQFATNAFLNFSYRKATNTLTAGEIIYVQLSNDGVTFTTVYTITGNGIFTSAYIDVPNVAINVAAYNTNNKTYLRFATSNTTDEGDVVYIDNISIKFLQYDQCYLVALAPGSLPSNVSLTTPASRAFKFTASGTCASTLDFGVKRMLTYSVNDENSTWKDVNVSGVVMINDFDQESNAQSFGTFLMPVTKTPLASGGSIAGTDYTGAAVANAGTLTFTASGSYTFDPSPSFTGTVSIPYQVCDNGSPSACDTSTLTITVNPLPLVGNSVIANNDEDISYGAAISNNLFLNDADPKNNTFSAILFKYDSNGDGVPDVSTIPGTVTVAGMDIFGNPVANAGSLSITAYGAYSFIPASGFIGSIDASYTISNTDGAVASANLHIDVVADIDGLQNDPPFAGDDFGYTTVNAPLTGSFISNDREPNNDPFSFGGTTINTSSVPVAIGSPMATTKGGTVQFYSDGTYKYIPPAGYTGPDLITYTICDVTAALPQPLCANAILHFLIGPGISITGKVWDDANGNVIDEGASEPETNAGGTLYVNLINEMGYVISAVPVASNGTYSITNVPPGGTYSLILSTVQGTPGSLAPAPTLQGGWVNTGETRNGVIDYGAAGIIDSRTFGFSDAVNFDFGIERMPNSDPYYVNIPTPVAGQIVTLNGGSNPPIPSGTDPEDCVTGCTLVGRTIVIDEAPLNANMYYNGVLVSSGQSIPNFDASLLTIEFTPVTVASQFTEFYYSFVDLAGVKDTVTAAYSLNWLTILPVKGLNLTANRTGTNVPLNWKTITEINSEYFEIERSTDGRNYTKIGSNVKAAGNSIAEKLYQSEDDISDVQSSTVYYRVKLIAISGKIAYSNVAVIKLPANGTIKVSPNPFSSSITINMPVEQNTSIGIRMMDMSGRAVLSTTQKVSKDKPQVTINNLGGLTRGIYVIEVIDLQTGKKAVSKLEKSN